MHMSEFVFCQTQISMSHISAYEYDFEGDLNDHQPCFIPNFKLREVRIQSCTSDVINTTIKGGKLGYSPGTRMALILQFKMSG